MTPEETALWKDEKSASGRLQRRLEKVEKRLAMQAYWLWFLGWLVVFQILVSITLQSIRG